MGVGMGVGPANLLPSVRCGLEGALLAAAAAACRVPLASLLCGGGGPYSAHPPRPPEGACNPNSQRCRNRSMRQIAAALCDCSACALCLPGLSRLTEQLQEQKQFAAALCNCSTCASCLPGMPNRVHRLRSRPKR